MTKLSKVTTDMREQMQSRGEISGVAGMDLGDNSSTICLLGVDGEVIERQRIKTSQAALQRYFGHWPRLRVVIEAGVHVHWVARLLEGLRHEVVAANPRRLKLITQSVSKNDRNDSQWLAELGRTNPKLLSPIRLRSQPSQQQRTMLRAREAAVEGRTKLINAIRGMAKSHGHRLANCDADAFARKMQKDCPPELRDALWGLLLMVAAATTQIKAYDRQIQKLCQQYAATKRLQSIRGVGPQTALAFVLTLDNDPGWVQRSRQAGALVGLRPKQRDSGESTPELGITKQGNRLLRKLLVQCSHYILSRHGVDSALRRWGLRLAQGGKRAKRRAVVAVARKLAVLLHVLWRRDEDFVPFPPGQPQTA